MKLLFKGGLILAVGLLVVSLAVHVWGKSRDAGPDAGGKPLLNIGKTETRSSISSTSTSCSSGDSGFSSRRVLLFADNPHPLSRRIAILLGQQLKDLPFIERLDTTNQPYTFTNGADAPDLFVSVDLASLKTGGLFSSSMKATVTATLGNMPWAGSYHSRDDSTPPLVEFAWNATLESETTFTGVRTDGYADAARGIADEFAKAIHKQIEELSGKYPALPELPSDFYGPYQPVADLDFLKEVQGRRIGSFCGLLSHNHTFWQFQTATNPVPQWNRIMSRLQDAGWKVSDSQWTNTADYRVCARLGEDAELEIFRRHRVFMDFTANEPKESSLQFVAHYRKSFSRAEREAAVEKLFTLPSTVERLLPFQNCLSSDQRKRFIALAEKSPGTSPRVCVQLAEMYLGRKQTNDAVVMLTRAKALAATVRDSAPLESNIESVTKKISPKKTLSLKVTPEMCRELGFLEITNATRTVGHERSLGQPLILFGSTERGVKICALTVGPSQKSTYPWSLVQTENGSRSSSWGCKTPTSHGDWQDSFTFNGQTIRITAVPLPEKKQVRFFVQIGG